MSDLSTQIRSYFDELGPSIDVEDVRAHPLIEVRMEEKPDHDVRRRRLVPAISFLVVAIVGVGLLSTLQDRGPADRSFVRVDVCQILVEATGPADMTLSHDQTDWGADVCLHDGWDSGWNFRHLLLRQSATSRRDARELIGQTNLLTEVRSLTWISVGSGRWVTENSELYGGMGFSAVAVSDPPYFFIVTEEDAEKATRVADSVSRELDGLAHGR